LLIDWLAPLAISDDNDLMSSDNTQRQLDFIIEQQARFSEGMLQLRDALLSLTNIVEKHDEQIKENSEQIKENRELIKEMTASLNALIRVVERHVSNHP